MKEMQEHVKNFDYETMKYDELLNRNRENSAKTKSLFREINTFSF